ncbi:MAG: hypothetical protein J0I20_21140 [Chloroflexi bacterium]|nr:hypothetical protein [Chloroflexota bacterium]OJV96540.1 MAG: hypothetical protein BGO39_09775 [Chloroflexi bacterium 54-19]
MQPTIVVRYVGLLLALLGIVMLIWRTASSGSGSGYDTVRLIHIIVALAFIGLLEAALARSKREGTINAQGRQLGMAGRGLATIALLIGIFLLLSLFLSWVTGDTYSIVVYFHAVFGILAVGIVVLLFSGRYRSSKSN